jgi:hypothetical protein
MYDLKGATLTKIPSQPRGYSVKVPGVAENRPSVLYPWNFFYFILFFVIFYFFAAVVIVLAS